MTLAILCQVSNLCKNSLKVAFHAKLTGFAPYATRASARSARSPSNLRRGAPKDTGPAGYMPNVADTMPKAAGYTPKAGERAERVSPSVLYARSYESHAKIRELHAIAHFLRHYNELCA